MFLSVNRSGYNRHDEQVCHGLFLVVFNMESGGELRAVVRHARMVQCGHWMMASVRVGQHKITLSGDYGGDGLPFMGEKQTADLWERLHPLPAELADAFWRGGGHNCSGSEAPAVREWARAHLDELRQLRQA